MLNLQSVVFNCKSNLSLPLLVPPPSSILSIIPMVSIYAVISVVYFQLHLWQGSIHSFILAMLVVFIIPFCELCGRHWGSSRWRGP